MRVIDQFDTQKDEMTKREGTRQFTYLRSWPSSVTYFTQTQCLLTIIHSLSFDCPQIQRKKREDKEGWKMDDNLINRIRSLGPFTASAIPNLFYRLSYFYSYTRNVQCPYSCIRKQFNHLWFRVLIKIGRHHFGKGLRYLCPKATYCQ